MLGNMERLTNIRKIAVLKATALGDYLAATPALYALRATYPNAEIVYLGRPLHAALVEGRPSPIDRVVIVPVSHGVRVEPSTPDRPEDPEELNAFFAAMQTEQFDLAIQMHGGGKNSNPFVKRLGAKVNVGMKTPDAPDMDRWMPYVVYQQEFMRLLELMALVGAKPVIAEPQFTVIDRDHDQLRAALPELRAPYVVIHPGASDLRRRWSPERFAELADSLAEMGYQIVLTGVENERALIAEITRLLRHPVVNACERLSLGALAALLRCAALVVSNDTGPVHLADAVKTPNVGIFWCGNYLNWSHFNRSRHRPLVSWITHCPLCGTDMMQIDPPRDTCKHDTSFVNGVSVADVQTAALELLAYAERFGR